MFLSKLYSAASVALGKVSRALDLAPARPLAQTRHVAPARHLAQTRHVAPARHLAQTRHVAPGLLAPARRPVPELRAPTRNIFGLIPPNQYENNQLPKKLQLGYALLHHWEICPLFLCVAFDIVVLLFGAIYTGFTQKVDTQFSKHNWNCISRNMDLRHPTIHKHVVLYQRYEPWPEMQAVLDKMTQAEHRLKANMDQCGKL